MTLVTVYALLGDDLRIIFWDNTADPIFLGITVASMVFFAIEIVLASIGKPDYFNSFFFWLDALSTLSLITDVEPFMLAVTGGGDEGQAEAAEAAAIARASRGARIGTRAGRMARIIRLIRLIRIVKLYKQANQAFKLEKRVNMDQKLGQHGSELEGYEDIPDKIDFKQLLTRDYKESKVGKMLSEYTTRKVIILVLAMLFSTPAMAVDTYLDEPDSY